MKRASFLNKIKDNAVVLKLAGLGGGVVAAIGGLQQVFAEKASGTASHIPMDVPGQFMAHSYPVKGGYYTDYVFHWIKGSEGNAGQCVAFGQHHDTLWVNHPNHVQKVSEEFCKQVAANPHANIDGDYIGSLMKGSIENTVLAQGQPVPPIVDPSAATLHGMYGLDKGVQIVGQSNLDISFWTGPMRSDVIRVITQQTSDGLKTTCESIGGNMTQPVTGWEPYTSCSTYAPSTDFFASVSKWFSGATGGGHPASSSGIHVQSLSDSFNNVSGMGMPQAFAEQASAHVTSVAPKTGFLLSVLPPEIAAGIVIAATGLAALAGFLFWRRHKCHQTKVPVSEVKI